MRTLEKATKRLLVLSLGAILLISTPMNASAESPIVPARKPAALRADPLALLRFPALNEEQPQSVPEKISEALPPVPGRKPEYKTPDVRLAAAPVIVPPPKPEPEPVVAAATVTTVKTVIVKETKTAAPDAKIPALPALEGYNKIYKSARKRTPAQRDSVVRLVGIVKQDISNGSPSRALKRLSSDKAVPYLDPVEKDQLQTLVARGYLLAGKIVQSYELASESAQRSGTYIPQAGWIAGLASWRMGKYDDAARMFSNSADATYSSSWQASASAYWASRSYMRAHKPQDVSIWLKRAAAHPRTFYGLIATRSLGLDYDFNWDVPSLTSAHKKTLEAHPAAREAIALVKKGHIRDGEARLSKIDVNNNPPLREALMAYAANKNLSALGMQLAQVQAHPKGGYYDAALYPFIPWKPKDGYTIDRALVHAIIRQESKFNPGAVSRSGAQGLMQVMPSTASYISGKSHFKNKKNHEKLRDPQTNLELGQRYIEKLLYQDHVDTELFSLVVAYNAGPGNLKRWKREMADMQDDPLLFIESIPMGETRAYVERVMSNYWIYRLRMNQPVPSLDAVAEGQWAQYVPIDGVKQAGIIPRLSLRLAKAD